MTFPLDLRAGERVTHSDYGQGVVLEPMRDGYLRAFFASGERQVPMASLQRQLSRTERVLWNVSGDPMRSRVAWLVYEAHALPMTESASALTSAKIDLLPHQVVLTHRVGTASPRRFLIADEVGLGKTIETALILRELASRGELNRALMVVPAGLVHNWHHELNEVFNLDFEVFGLDGDITDRRTNAFVKHDRLIASIDKLKRPQRIRRLLEAPHWDLVVFDEAHHLAAHRVGGKVHKTENYKLAEVLKNHTRDLLLLSATPHQGSHFQFWMLVQLLNPTLFSSPEEMIDYRHRLNSVMFRRTKADACRSDGSPLFARRWVHTESFPMNEDERHFYEKLREYLQEGFDLARRQGNQGRALGFLMAIFQKIAASSFAAVRRTLKRRLLMLTLQEALLRDKELDIEGREHLTAEARVLIQEEFQFSDDPIGHAEIERILGDLKSRLVKKVDVEVLELVSTSYASEYSSADAEEAASAVINLHLPEERQRIAELLLSFPTQRETKVQKLLDGLGILWRQNPDEKIVIFATYLGTVNLIAQEIERTYPGQGVVVLRGGNHGAKVAAERRFRRPDGPRVLISTAAGREGINLQFARILFNVDLPWNPMDLEQRIGRIHRYGQSHTAQVYNLVLSDTIEGRIFLLLDEKLVEIAKTLGKVDDQGNIAEDLRTQVLGQLSERLNYNRLYQEALSDPELKRTHVELEVALSNSHEARKVVLDLFQDLDRFSLEEYRPFKNLASSFERMVQFLCLAIAEDDRHIVKIDQHIYAITASDGQQELMFTTDRDLAIRETQLELIGIDHPIMQQEIKRWQSTPPEDIGIAIKSAVESGIILTLWTIECRSAKEDRKLLVQAIAVDLEGKRVIDVEKKIKLFIEGVTTVPQMTIEKRKDLIKNFIEPALYREMSHRDFSNGESGFIADLIGYIEIVPSPVS
ncbi:DEAD/DEAH box helicase [Deinococcus aquatilis]|uniref:DEAD/DEAH box helicase n=1 Tax=Deinococcus aquatilis TaxID=519440 RepID=UPI0003A8C533|nr:SNF2-related protein [Deinococcus aquatilis]